MRSPVDFERHWQWLQVWLTRLMECDERYMRKVREGERRKEGGRERRKEGRRDGMRNEGRAEGMNECELVVV